MTRLVVVVPLKGGAQDEARKLLEQGPPMELEKTRFDRHDVYLTRQEAVFVFETSGEVATLRVMGENPSVWRAAAAWQRLMAGAPRTAETAYAWSRGANTSE